MRLDVIGKDNLPAVLHAFDGLLSACDVLRALGAIIGIIDQRQVDGRFVHLVHDAENVRIARRILAAGLGRQGAQLGVGRFLRRVHVDHVRHILALRKLQADFFGSLAMDIPAHDVAQFVHVLKALGDQGIFHQSAGGQRHAILEPGEPVQEFFAVAHADALERFRRHMREHRVNLDGAVLGRRRGQAVDVLPVLLVEQPARFQVEVE